jgi:hypothetical protein
MAERDVPVDPMDAIRIVRAVMRNGIAGLPSPLHECASRLQRVWPDLPNDPKNWFTRAEQDADAAGRKSDRGTEYRNANVTMAILAVGLIAGIDCWERQVREDLDRERRATQQMLEDIEGRQQRFS